MPVILLYQKKTYWTMSSTHENTSKSQYFTFNEEKPFGTDLKLTFNILNN